MVSSVNTLTSFLQRHVVPLPTSGIWINQVKPNEMISTKSHRTFVRCDFLILISKTVVGSVMTSNGLSVVTLVKNRLEMSNRFSFYFPPRGEIPRAIRP